jgi:hypothetical protein
LSRSVEKAFGELFTIEAFKPTDNVNGRYVADVSRPTLVEIQGVWHGPTKSSAPMARGAASDESASSWRVSRPEVHFDDAILLWAIASRGCSTARSIPRARPTRMASAALSSR